ncbi:MAG TPA: hypothetical protein VMJ65_22715 [Solirubrobacteraceae bacterium]|nr:hypothetical protein [Solirubrobacteraceae bacterium]
MSSRSLPWDLNVVITRPWEFGVAVVGPDDDPILEHETPITLHSRSCRGGGAMAVST